MTLSFPRTDMQDVRIVAQKPFSLMHRQELSREASGVIRGKDLGPPLWATEITTKVMRNSALIEYLAKLNSLDGVLNSLSLYEMRRPYPRNYVNGVFDDTGVLFDVSGTNLNQIRLDDLPANFAISVGDFFAFDWSDGENTYRALHQVVEAVTANGSGLTGFFEVRPEIRGVEFVDGSSPPVAVTFKRPTGHFIVMPGSIQTNDDGPSLSTVSFQALQSV